MADDDETPYSNTGLKRWEAGRKQWLDIERSRLARPEKMKRAVNVDIDLVIDRIFSPESDGYVPFTNHCTFI